MDCQMPRRDILKSVRKQIANYMITDSWSHGNLFEISTTVGQVHQLHHHAANGDRGWIWLDPLWSCQSWRQAWKKLEEFSRTTVGSLSLVILSGNPWHPTKENDFKKGGFPHGVFVKARRIFVGPQDGSAWKVPSGGSVRIIAPDDYYFGPLIETAATRTALRMWLRLVISKHAQEEMWRYCVMADYWYRHAWYDHCISIWKEWPASSHLTCRWNGSAMWGYDPLVSEPSPQGAGQVSWRQTAEMKQDCKLKISGCVSITPYALNSLNAFEQKLVSCR